MSLWRALGHFVDSGLLHTDLVVTGPSSNPEIPKRSGRGAVRDAIRGIPLEPPNELSDHNNEDEDSNNDDSSCRLRRMRRRVFVRVYTCGPSGLIGLVNEEVWKRFGGLKEGVCGYDDVFVDVKSETFSW
jgi:hypothetical protein